MSEESNEQAIEQPAAFTQEQVNEMLAKVAADKDAEYTGVLAKNNELLGEKKAAKQKALEAEEARQLAIEESARKNGNLEELEKTLTTKHQSELEKYKAQLQERDSMILGGKKDAIIADLSSEFISSGGGKLMVSNLVDVTYDDGKVVTQYKGLDGNIVTTDANEFKKYMRENSEITPYLRPVNSSGGGSNGNKSTGGASGQKRSNMTAQDKSDFINTHGQDAFLKLPK